MQQQELTGISAQICVTRVHQGTVETCASHGGLTDTDIVNPILRKASYHAMNHRIYNRDAYIAKTTTFNQELAIKTTRAHLPPISSETVVTL